MGSRRSQLMQRDSVRAQLKQVKSVEFRRKRPFLRRISNRVRKYQ